VICWWWLSVCLIRCCPLPLTIRPSVCLSLCCCGFDCNLWCRDLTHDRSLCCIATHSLSVSLTNMLTVHRLFSLLTADSVRRAIKKLSAWPGSVQNIIKIVFASYSSKAQNTTCTIWLLGCRYIVHFSGCRLFAFDIKKLVMQCKEMTVLTVKP